MNTVERIHVEIDRLPGELAEEVLDFILFLGQRRAIRPNEEQPESILDLARTAQRHFPAVNAEVRHQEFAALRNEWDRLP
ncbi:MAG: DUF2281 domain-containing protein [Magnetococcus sp. YQC-9]